MVVKIKPNEIVENKDVKSFYEKQDELINEIRGRILSNENTVASQDVDALKN